LAIGVKGKGRKTRDVCICIGVCGVNLAIGVKGKRFKTRDVCICLGVGPMSITGEDTGCSE